MTTACTCCERTDDRGTQMGLCERCWRRGWATSPRLRVDPVDEYERAERELREQRRGTAAASAA